MNDRLQKKVMEEASNGHRFVGIYERSFVTNLPADDIVGAIKYFYGHYNSILIGVWDDDKSILYVGKENDEPDERGYYNHSYYDDETLIYNQDEATAPIVKIEPEKITKDSLDGYIDRKGNFYSCWFEQHYYLAKELFVSKTVLEPKGYYDYKSEECLDDMNWVKISSKRINFKPGLNKLTRAQKKKNVHYMEVLGDEKYQFQYSKKHKYDIEIELSDNY